MAGHATRQSDIGSVDKTGKALHSLHVRTNLPPSRFRSG